MAPRSVPRRGLLLALAGGLLLAGAPAGPRPARAGDERKPAAAGARKPLTLEDVRSSRLAPLPSIVAWRPGRDAWVEWRRPRGSKHEHLVEVDAASGTERSLLSLVDFEADRPAGPGGASAPMRGIGRAGPPSLLFSDDGRAAVVPLRGDLFHVDLESGTRRRLTRTTSPISDPRFAPDGRKVSFSRDHDLFAVVLEDAGPREIRLTTGGSEDLLHGELDWVYPEELDCSTAAWWSPDSTRVAFLRLDETSVPRVPIADPEPLHGSVRWQRYPKAGDPNPVPGIGVVGLDGAPPAWLDLGPDRDVYVPWATWWPDGTKVAVAILSRSQQRFEIRVFDPKGGAGTAFWTEEDPRWVDLPPPPRFLEKTRAMLLRSRRDGWWRHHVVPLDGGKPVALTPQGREAGRLLAVDEAAGDFFYEAPSTDRLRTSVLRARLGGGAAPVVLGDPAWTHAASFSTTGRVYFDTTSRATDAPRAAVRDRGGSVVRAVGDASTPEMADAIRVAPEFVSVPGPDGVALDAVLWKPTPFHAKRHWAVLVEVYGGPGSRMVRDAFSERGLVWRGLLAQEGILSFSLDGRGTGGRGKDFEGTVNRRLGLLETEDQARGARWLAERPYVDAGRIGISGWSFGGTVAALAMTKTPGVFRAGVAGAPVTDWRLYDTIYTERYLGRPADEAAAYADTSVVASAGAVTGSLLLLHGLLDDNVHVQNTVRLTEALIRAKKPFEHFLYPGAGHGGGGPASQLDQNRRVLDFLRRTLLPPAGAAEGR